MSLVTRVSIAFLVALALALVGFSASLYYLAGLRLRLALDQELEATLDHFPDRSGSGSGRVMWAIYDETGRRIENTPGSNRPMVLDGRDLGPIAVDVATTIKGSDGQRWRVLARRLPGGRHHHGPETKGAGHRPGPRGRDERKAPHRINRVRAMFWPPGPRSSRWKPKFDGWGLLCLLSRWGSGRWLRASDVISPDALWPRSP